MRGCASTGPRRRTISATPSRSCVSRAERFKRPYDSRELANLRERMVRSPRPLNHPGDKRVLAHAGDGFDRSTWRMAADLSVDY